MLRLPVRWDKTVIVVMNDVRVSSPYHPDSVVGGTPAANERVKKVVNMFRFLFVMVCLNVCISNMSNILYSCCCMDL